MTLGEKIKARRAELGITVDELAEKIGKNRATIYRYESNEIGNVPTTILKPLADALQTTPMELIGWENVIDKTTVGERVKQLRIENGYSIEKLAELTRIPKACLLLIETNDRNEIPSEKLFEYMESLADIFNVYVDFIYGWSDEWDKDSADEERTFYNYLSKHNLNSQFIVRKNEIQILSNYRKLNQNGKEKAEEYIIDLTEQDKYIKRSEE